MPVYVPSASSEYITFSYDAKDLLFSSISIIVRL